MADEADLSGAAASAGAGIPFVPLFLTLLFVGAVFLVFNIPLLIALAQGQTFPSFDTLLLRGYVAFWRELFSPGDGAFVLAALFFLSLVLGLLLTPIDRLLSYFISLLAHSIERRVAAPKRRKQLLFFSSARFAARDYSAFLSWLMRDKNAKLHWEWELFNYYLYWGLFTNVAVFVLLDAMLMWGLLPAWQLLLFNGLPLCIALSYSLTRSVSMGATHEFYIERFRASSEGQYPANRLRHPRESD